MLTVRNNFDLFETHWWRQHHSLGAKKKKAYEECKKLPFLCWNRQIWSTSNTFEIIWGKPGARNISMGANAPHASSWCHHYWATYRYLQQCHLYWIIVGVWNLQEGNKYVWPPLKKKMQTPRNKQTKTKTKKKKKLFFFVLRIQMFIPITLLTSSRKKNLEKI